MELVNAGDVEPEAVDWLWNERIPRGMITIIGGKPDQGKGLFVNYLAAEVSKMKFRNEDGTLRYGRSIYSVAEDSYGIMIRPRLEAAGAIIKNVDLTRFRLPIDFDWLEGVLMAMPIDLLAIDPLASHLSNGIKRQSDRIRDVTDPLKELIEKTHTACVVVDHALKNIPRTAHPISAIGGSGSGMVAAARMAYLLGVDPADVDRRVLCNVKANIRSKPSEYSFQVDTQELPLVGEMAYLIPEGETEFNPMDFLTIPRAEDGKRGRPALQRANAAEWLVTFLFDEDEPVSATRVYEQAKLNGFAQKTLRRAATERGIIKDPPGGGPKVTWALPPALKLLMEQMNFDQPSSDLDGDLADLLGT